jgi:TPP-dependent pyruvate/acetoin dehydrogenase alpha subunit
VSASLTRQQHLDLYYYMQLNRQLEERMVRLFRQNKIVGGLYSSLGQEAISIGTAYALEPRDWLAPMIRNIGALLVKGFKPRDIFTQHMAKYTSPTRGKDGTSHFGDLKLRHTVSPISMLGDLIPVMTGVAMAGRYLGHNIVTMTWIGDGGSSTGAFHEGLNFAATQKAALVLVLENNQWAYSTPVTRQVPLKNLADRAKAYGIHSTTVDGNDVVAVHHAAKHAIDECRAGNGPVLIEAKTMRMKGHAQHDPAEYVPKEMFDYWKARDPIPRYERYLTEHKIWDSTKKAEIDARIERELDADQKFAEESPLPPPELAEEGAYCEGCHKIEADWKRPKEEVMPPKSSIKAEWTTPKLGGLDADLVAQAEIPGAREASGAGTNGGAPPAAAAAAAGASEPARDAVAVAPAGTPAKPAAKPASPDDMANAPALRVPFGRGPKDREFERQRNEARQKKQNQRPDRGPHKRRKR